MSTTDIATWYEVTFATNGEATQTIIGTGTALNFAGVEAGAQSLIKCIRIKFSKPITGLKFWMVNNLSSGVTGDVFEDGWSHGYHIRSGESGVSSLLNANTPEAFTSTYYNDGNYDNKVGKKTPFGYDANAKIIDNPETGEKEFVDDPTSNLNYNSFVPIPRNTQVFTQNPNYYQWGDNTNGSFGNADGISTENNAEEWTTPYIYLVVNPPASADGGAKTGWGYRISFLYS